jgi:hypothetical protein
MRIYARVLASTGLVLALGVCLLCTAPAGSAADKKDDKKDEKKDDDKPSPAIDPVAKMADMIEKGDMDKAKKAAADVADKYSLGDAMNVLKPRAKGGIGVGKEGQYNPDGIELQIQQKLSKKTQNKSDLEKSAADIERMADIVAGIAEITDLFTPKKKVGDKDPKDWKDYTTDMKEASAELAKAAKAKDADAIKKAAQRLNSSCNNCHGKFRDDQN